jgi:hypothetical protein
VENPTSEGATTDKINLTELREALTTDGKGVPTAHLLALIDAVEAAYAYITSDEQPNDRDPYHLVGALARFQP